MNIYISFLPEPIASLSMIPELGLPVSAAWVLQMTMFQCVLMTEVTSANTGVVTLIMCVMQTFVSPCLSANQRPVFSEEDQSERRLSQTLII